MIYSGHEAVGKGTNRPKQHVRRYPGGMNDRKMIEPAPLACVRANRLVYFFSGYVVALRS